MLGKLYDAVIVGGGPAGMAAAIRLLREGYGVALIEKKKFPRHKVCGCCYSARTLRELEELGVRPRFLKNSSIRLVRKKRTIHSSLHSSYTLERAKLDTLLQEYACGQGLHFFEECAYFSHSVENNRVLVSVRSRSSARTLQGRLLIMANGLPSRRNGNIVGLQCYLTEHMSSRELRMQFCSWGYVGSCKVADGLINVAASVRTDRIRQAQAEIPTLFPTAEQRPSRWFGTPALRFQNASPCSERVFYIGDAASYFEPLTGEGVFWALRSAREMTPIAIQALQHGWKTDLESHWHRRNLIQARSGQRVSRILAKSAHSAGLQRYAFGALDSIPFLTRGILARLTLTGVT